MLQGTASSESEITGGSAHFHRSAALVHSLWAGPGLVAFLDHRLLFTPTRTNRRHDLLLREERVGCLDLWNGVLDKGLHLFARAINMATSRVWL